MTNTEFKEALESPKFRELMKNRTCVLTAILSAFVYYYRLDKETIMDIVNILLDNVCSESFANEVLKDDDEFLRLVKKNMKKYK